MKKDDKVYHERLGHGTVTKDGTDQYTEVKWDKKPDFDFNAGQNPCLVLTGGLIESVSNCDCDCDDEDDKCDGSCGCSDNEECSNCMVEEEIEYGAVLDAWHKEPIKITFKFY